MKLYKTILTSTMAVFMCSSLLAQQAPLPVDPDLDQLIKYALENKISIKQAYLDEEIGEREIASAVSGWFPQISATGGINHYLQIPSNVIGGQVIQMGQKNSSSLTFQADQTILDPAMMQASKASKFVRRSYEQSTEAEKINTVVDVSKAYYDILTTEEQTKIIEENIIRLQRQFNDANARYETGLVDKTDFQRAQISLNNARADLKKTIELRKYKYDYLKELLGLDISQSINLAVNGENLEGQIHLDTTETLNIASRIEYRQLQNIKEIQQVNTQYQKWNFLPRIGAFANYQMNYRNDTFSKMYNDNFPNSILGLSLSIPIFQGGKRIHELRKSELEEQRIEWDLLNLQNQINTQHSAAIANYKANMIDWRNARQNVDLSEEVYNTIKLQYDAGIKTYLDLMTAETDLRTSQLNYLNSLYSVLASKIDVQQALGTITIN